MTTTKIMTDYGEMSITLRSGYYYAIRTWNRKKRQIYLGKTIPDLVTLNEVASDLFSDDKDYWTKHSKKSKSQAAPASEDTNSLSLVCHHVEQIENLAKSRGEDAIAKELAKVIAMLKVIK